MLSSFKTAQPDAIDAKTLLKNFAPDTSDYYQAILQNLFFATLNTPINEQAFSRRNGRDHRNASKYRYADLLENPQAFMQTLKQVPFVNGGLFDCLDTFEATRDGGQRIDGFTDNPTHRHRLYVPTKLFFDPQKGLFPLFNHYKFTVEESTPIEQEVALDPELLGQVFENLLGAYNPETQSTARKATGSYYTPRQIVDYMVDEALIAYFLQKVEPYDGDKKYLEDRLREDLLVYDQRGEIGKQDNHLIDKTEVAPLIQAIDALKIIDSAVGSGAFPMGILNKLVLVLRKLDPQNIHWKQQQLTQTEKIDDPESKESAKQAIEAVFSEANRYNDYSRKLYLIQNCIYGVDIQPIAITIAKLRFFISLIIEQVPSDNPVDNYGIRPLPNLETKFVAGNTLIGLKELKETEFQLLLENDQIRELRDEIATLRAKYFSVNTRSTKQKYIDREKECRHRLAETLAKQHAGWCQQAKKKITEQIAQVPQPRAQQQLRKKLEKEYTINEAKLTAGLAEANRIAHWNAYDQNAVADFFDAEWMFGVSDGFDIVIGNPPYGAKIPKNELTQIKNSLQDTKNSNSAALFIDCGKNQLMKPNGILTFIVPKSLLYSQRWQSLAFTLSEKATVLVDVEQAFDKVLLEQIVFVYAAQCNTEFYTARKFINQIFAQTTQISRDIPKTFEAWICDVSNDEIQLGLKLNSIGIHLVDISENMRGLSVQKFLKPNGEIKVIGGRNVKRYCLDGVRGFASKETLASLKKKIQLLLQPKIMSQNIVTRKKINATVDKKGNILGLDTVENTFITNPDFNLNFVAALFNSTLVNWYVHRFIFCSASLTTHFDNYYISKIPLPFVTPEAQQPIVNLVEQTLSAKQENPQTETKAHERKINALVYELYGLTEAEIALVESMMGTES